MTLEGFRTYCLAKPDVTEEFPFGPETLVYKVKGKMFALTDVDTFASINLKVDPEVGAELKEQHASVIDAYHMNKKHWITVLMDHGVADKLVMAWIDESYRLVSAGKKKTR